MPPRNASKSNGQTNVSKGGRPSTLVETHPELQTNYMEMKPMILIYLMRMKSRV